MMKVVARQYDVFAVPYGNHSWQGQVRTIAELADKKKIQGFCFPFFVLENHLPFLFFRDIHFRGTERELNYVLDKEMPADQHSDSNHDLVRTTYLEIQRDLALENENLSGKIEQVIDALYELVRPTLDVFFSPSNSSRMTHYVKEDPTNSMLCQLHHFPEFVEIAKQTGKFFSIRRMRTGQRDFYENI